MEREGGWHAGFKAFCNISRRRVSEPGELPQNKMNCINSAIISFILQFIFKINR